MQQVISSRRARCWLIPLAVATGVWLLACRPPIDRARADALAAARLQEYVRAERLDPQQFAPPEVREQAGQWLYTYEYRGAPKQSVAVTAFADGHVELSRMLDQSR
jgi:prepilin-type processing-associated H-X9-DG protein